MTEKPRDLIVIGTGSAGTAAARGCRKAGWRVAIVDERPYGGTCPLRGCDPKKVLVGLAATIERDRRLRGKGIAGGEPRIAWPELHAFVRTFTDPVPAEREASLAEAGIETLKGAARFTGPAAIELDGRALEARHVVVASGARPATLDMPGAELLTTSDQFLDLPELPAHIVFVGGGYISFEFAHVAIRAGSRVTILHAGARFLDDFDPHLVDMLGHRSRSLGIELHATTTVTAVERRDGRFLVSAEAGGESREFSADMVVHGAGRVPDLDHLDLETAGIEREEKGVSVNAFLQSVSNPAVYAAGDAAAAGLPLTPVASHQGRVVAANLVDGNHRKAEVSGVPAVVFTIPPLAAVGLSESDAHEEGLDCRVRFAKTGDWYSSRRLGETCAGHKVLIENGTDRVLGAHLLGPHAPALINVFGLAIQAGMTASQLGDILFAYPTRASDIGSMLS